MSLKTGDSIFRSFSFRLTLWYALVFIASLIIIFFISYRILSADLLHVVDRGLLAQTSKVDEEFSVKGLDEIRNGMRQSIEEEGKNRIFYRILKSNLDIVETSDPLKWPCLNFPQMSQWASQASGGRTIYRTLKPPDRNYRVRIISRGIDNGRYIIQLGKTMSDEEELVAIYRKVFAQAAFILLLCAAFLAWIEAQKAMVHIEGLMRGLNDVTNNIAHDMRTPITRIRGLAETSLGKKNGAGGEQESLGIIVEECDHLMATMNTMLEIAQADAGLKKIERMRLDIAELARKGCELFEPVAQDKGLVLDVIIPHEPLMVMAEPSRLQRVISNLLDNAVKFSHPGGRIQVEVKKTGAEAIISVQDSGIGIAKDQLVRIFEKFYRIESSRSLPGNGLGLSYVQSIVSSLNGRVTVESVLDKGSTFIVRLPLG